MERARRFSDEITARVAHIRAAESLAGITDETLESAYQEQLELLDQLVELRNRSPDEARGRRAEHTLRTMGLTFAATQDEICALWAQMEIASGEQPGGWTRVGIPHGYAKSLIDRAALPRIQMVDVEDPGWLEEIAATAKERRRLSPRSDARIVLSAYFVWLRERHKFTAAQTADRWLSITSGWVATQDAPTKRDPIDRAAFVAYEEWRRAGGVVETLLEERVRQHIAGLKPVFRKR
ncbi:MAG: hypothetical protein M3T56_10270 [Chloroflexota bacterium]|nr:hypothetical protein [Chloroflexota bacterium]